MHNPLPYYLCQRNCRGTVIPLYVCVCVCVCVCVFVTRISQNVIVDLNQIMWNDRSSAKD